MNRLSRGRTLSLPSLAVALLIGGLAYVGSATITTQPAQAQGTLTAPGGQGRVTAPGGLRGRAAMRQRRMQKRHR